jgi:hypothetical protein
MHEPAMVAQAKRVSTRRSKERESTLVPAPEAAGVTDAPAPRTPRAPTVTTTRPLGASSAKRSQPKRGPRSKRGKR